MLTNCTKFPSVRGMMRRQLARQWERRARCGLHVSDKERKKLKVFARLSSSFWALVHHPAKLFCVNIQREASIIFQTKTVHCCPTNKTTKHITKNL